MKVIKAWFFAIISLFILFWWFFLFKYLIDKQELVLEIDWKLINEKEYAKIEKEKKLKELNKSLVDEWFTQYYSKNDEKEIKEKIESNKENKEFQYFWDKWDVEFENVDWKLEFEVSYNANSKITVVVRSLSHEVYDLSKIEKNQILRIDEYEIYTNKNWNWKILIDNLWEESYYVQIKDWNKILKQFFIRATEENRNEYFKRELELEKSEWLIS